MRVSTRVRYGTRALVELAMHGDQSPLQIELLAEKHKLSARYLAKIVQDLRRAGLVRSVRGAHGGYVLHHPADQITVLDIWEALEGPIQPVECLNDPECCEFVQSCVTRDVWCRFQQGAAESLRQVTIASIAADGGCKRASSEWSTSSVEHRASA